MTGVCIFMESLSCLSCFFFVVPSQVGALGSALRGLGPGMRSVPRTYPRVEGCLG